MGARLRIPPDYYKDFINLVLTCSGCNGFKNRYNACQEPKADWTLEEFLGLRDNVFEEGGSVDRGQAPALRSQIVRAINRPERSSL